jgi:hypothetical protein
MKAGIALSVGFSDLDPERPAGSLGELLVFLRTLVGDIEVVLPGDFR